MIHCHYNAGKCNDTTPKVYRSDQSLLSKADEYDSISAGNPGALANCTRRFLNDKSFVLDFLLLWFKQEMLKFIENTVSNEFLKKLGICMEVEIVLRIACNLKLRDIIITN